MTESLYLSVLLGLLLVFLVIRCGYGYGIVGFGLLVYIMILPLFICLFLFKILGRCRLFFGGFVPLGSPLWISPFVRVIELVRYCIRPVILLFRPYVNLSIGCYCGVALGGLVLVNLGVLLFLTMLFLYEVFVAVMH